MRNESLEPAGPRTIYGSTVRAARARSAALAAVAVMTALGGACDGKTDGSGDTQRVSAVVSTASLQLKVLTNTAAPTRCRTSSRSSTPAAPR